MLLTPSFQHTQHIFKAIPRNAFCAVAPPDFSSDNKIEGARVTPLPTKLVKYDGIEASICAIKALAVYP